MVHEILLPTDKDVLMGQSPNLRSHPGNARLKELVKHRFVEYCQASKLAKTQIAKEIIQQMYNEERRFLKQPEKKRIGSIQDSTWILESDSVRIRDKVASQFRGLLKERNRRGADSHSKYNNNNENHQIRKAEDKIPHKKSQDTKAWHTRSLPLKKRKIKYDDETEFREGFNTAWRQMQQPKTTSALPNTTATTATTARSVSFDDLSAPYVTAPMNTVYEVLGYSAPLFAPYAH